jgi:hypothetical protein
VIEIGTYLAGTSEIMAHALLANGQGHLHTVVPYRGEEERAIMAQWPEQLRRHVTFYETTSAASLAEFGFAGCRAGLTLIDGNHEFEFALFHVFQSNRLSEPNALVFMELECIGRKGSSCVIILRGENLAWDRLQSVQYKTLSGPWYRFFGTEGSRCFCGDARNLLCSRPALDSDDVGEYGAAPATSSRSSHQSSSADYNSRHRGC